MIVLGEEFNKFKEFIKRVAKRHKPTGFTTGADEKEMMKLQEQGVKYNNEDK